MKRILVLSMTFLLVGCSGWLVNDAPDSYSNRNGPNTSMDRSEVENLLLTLDHIDCNLDLFDYEEGRTKIKCK